MPFFILKIDLKPKENFSFRQELSENILDNYYDNRIGSKDESGIKIQITSKEERDIIFQAGLLVVTDSFKAAMAGILNENEYKFINCEINVAVDGKRSQINRYLLTMPRVKFFNYKKSIYEGIKEEELIFSIKKMIIDEQSLNGKPIARFNEIVTAIIINDSIKKIIDSYPLNGVKMISIDEWTF